MTDVQIVDVHIRKEGDESSALAAQLHDDTISGLSRPTGQKSLPTMLLYDQRGLRLYDDITTEAPEYYLFGAEEEILKSHAVDIVRTMHAGTAGVVPGEVVLELGSG
jgi:L-histidine Nalpha-methyltransferase / hercynylcysteine S-oxide synthase